MIRIRRSHLEEFRRIVATDYGDEAALVRAISGQGDEPNWMMKAGTAWHWLLEHGTEGAHLFPLEQVECQGWTFTKGDVLSARQHTGSGLYEVNARRVIDCWGTLVELECTADHIRGLHIQDHKTKFTPPDARDYEQQLQWRVYLWVFEALSFQYNLWHFGQPKDSHCTLYDVYPFRFWPYPGLEADIRRWTSHFLDWAHRHKLIPFLEVS